MSKNSARSRKIDSDRCPTQKTESTLKVIAEEKRLHRIRKRKQGETVVTGPLESTDQNDMQMFYIIINNARHKTARHVQRPGKNVLTGKTILSTRLKGHFEVEW